MSGTFNVCSSFNQPIDQWDVSSVTTMTSFLRSAGSMSDQNYSDAIVSWALLPVQPNVVLDAWTTKRLNTTTVTDAYNILVSVNSWIINDGGVAI